MADDTLKWVIPAISIGYHVCNDECGRFRFYTDEVEIIHRCGGWVAQDLHVQVDPPRCYADLQDALKAEYGDGH